MADKLNMCASGAAMIEFTACNCFILTSSYPGAESFEISISFITSSYVTGVSMIEFICLFVR